MKSFTKLFTKLFLSVFIFLFIVVPVNAGGLWSSVLWDKDGALWESLISKIKTLNITSTASVETWLAKYSGSFSRSSIINVFDFEEILQKDIPNDVIGLYGGRRVTNFCLYSKDASQWTGNMSYLSNNIFQATAQYNTVYFTATIATKESEEYRLTLDIEVLEGGQLNNIAIYHGNSETGGYTVLPLQIGLHKYSIKILGRIGDGVVAFGLQDRNSSNWAKIYIINAQFECITGQTNDSPSACILTEGSVVTKFYNTENGNTVTSNVVTEAEGDALENVIGGAFWPSTTNVIPSAEYRDFSHANWNKTNGSITAGSIVLIDGTTVADKNTFTASATNATIIKTQYTSAAGVHAGGIFIKRKTGTGAIEVTVDNGVTWVAVTSQVAGDSGWHLCETTLPTVANPELGVRLVTDTDAVYLDWAQLDDGYARVSSHPIAGGVTLGAQDFHFANNNLIHNSKGAIIVELQLLPDNAFDGGYVVTNDAGDGRILYLSSAWMRSYDGTYVAQFTAPPATYSKLGGSWWDNEKSLALNGSYDTPATYDGTWGTGNIYIGSSNGTANQCNGIISKLSFYYNTKVTQAEMEEVTTPGCYVPIGNERVVDEFGEYVYDGSGECVYAPR